MFRVYVKLFLSVEFSGMFEGWREEGVHEN